MGFEQLGRKLMNLGQDAKSGVQKVGETYQVNNKLNDEKKALTKLYAAIGKHIYHLDTQTPPEGLEDEFAAVLDKPAGLAVHPTLNYPDKTLANGWLWHLEQRGQAGVFRPVNRIDKNTSGLVLCAGNSFAAPILAETAHKCYLAVTEELLPEDDGTIDAPIARRGDSIIGRTVAPDGKPSITRYRVLARGGGHTLAACIPVTGRTHQIRVHMSHLGCPLAGDTLYGGHTERIGRHALHCAALAFRHPLDGSLHSVRCPLPPDMGELCRECGMPPVSFDTLFALIQELSPKTRGVEPKTPFAYFIREND